MLEEGTRVGDLRVRGLLGEGAMGRVYLAEDTTLGRRVALKLIKRSVLQRHGVERFLEEARATASFNHPHIVTLYAVGEHDGRPYLALEYLDGASLRVRLATGPVPMGEALRFGRAIADAIAEAHRRGLVHADLKPENVVIPSDGRVRVVDFGLARLAGAASDAASGTPAYMAPERWRGAAPTGAIDIWSLGVMLHELITGGRPIPDHALPHLMFAADPLEIPELPAEPWARLVRDCLALDPERRPSAEEVVRRLDALLDRHGAISGEGSRAARGAAADVQHLVTELVTPPAGEARPFEGRRELLAALVHSGCAALETRTPTLVTIRGDAGIGKSRLAAALRHELSRAAPKARVLALGGQDPAAGEVDGTLREILRRLAAPAMLGRGRDVRAHLREQVGHAWPAVALSLGWLGRDAPELQPLAQAPGALRIAAIEATSRLIRRAAEQGPLCILLDDAHLADATTLDALELATLARAGAAPLWICVLVRPSFDELRPSWGERAERAEAFELEPLVDAAAEELCRALLHPAENLPAQLVEAIAARAQGNAMLLGELCRALKSEGIIRQERTGAWILETDRIDDWPRTPHLSWLTERELRRLPPDLVVYAQLAAVLGPRFDTADMIGVLERLEASPAWRRPPLELEAALAQLDRVQLLRARGHRGHEFRNAMLCEAVRAAIPEPLGTELHRAAFEHYRDQRHVPEERRRPRLAFHAAGAGLREPAARAYEALAAEALYRHRYVEAEASYSRMLGLVDGGPPRQAALHGRGLARYMVGRYEDALDDLHRAHALAAEHGDPRGRLMILLDEATVLDWLASFRRSAELVEQAAGLVAGDAEPAIAARVATGRARSLWRLGKSVEARAALFEAVGLAEAAGGAAYESLNISLIMLGAVLSDLGEIHEAREALDRALSMARARGDRLHELAVLNNRRKVWIAEKDVERAVDDLQANLEIGRALGLVFVELIGTFNVGELLYQAGDLEAAWPYVERAVELATRRSDLLPRPIARLLELRLLAAEGRWQEVQALGAEIAELHRAAQAQGRTDAALLPSEEVLLEAALLASTGGGAESWAGVRARSLRCSEEQQPIEVVELQALGELRAGDVAGARRALDEALDLARRIPNVMETRLLRRRSWIDARRP